MGAAWAAHRELRSLLRWVGACAGGGLAGVWFGMGGGRWNGRRVGGASRAALAPTVGGGVRWRGAGGRLVWYGWRAVEWAPRGRRIASCARSYGGWGRALAGGSGVTGPESPRRSEQSSRCAAQAALDLRRRECHGRRLHHPWLRSYTATPMALICPSINASNGRSKPSKLAGCSSTFKACTTASMVDTAPGSGALRRR